MKSDALGGADNAEFDTIRSLLARWGPLAEGVGDDAALVRAPRGDTLVVSVDDHIEGRHFKREWLSPREIGYRAVAAALSDLAAMAAKPVGILVALAVPRDWRNALLDLADGIGDAAKSVNTKILGGNLAGADELSIATTVLGSTFAPLARKGAQPGNAVYVTGRLGGVRLATVAFEKGRPPEAPLRARFAKPIPRIDEARWLADAGATACIDVSDGLAADASHVAAASNVILAIDAERVPCVDGASPTDALASGEEFELLVTAPPGVDVEAFARRFRLPLTEIGRVDGGGPGVVIREGGKRVAAPKGYDHFV